MFRVKNPLGDATSDWYHPVATSILLPHNLAGMLFQSTIAMLILVGFESSTALSAEAKNPKRDILRGVILSLAIQGLFAYLLEYFADPGDAHGLSKIAKHFIAGQLAHARGMCAVLAPLVNSYKRLVAGYEAPVYISWARINRSALIRVPRATESESTRLELRCPDPSCNPYLAFAVMLADGLDGICRELPVPDATEENIYLIENLRQTKTSVLPGSLHQALNALEEDKVIQEALGTHTYDNFISAKRQEWEEYRLVVTDWELDKYLPNI